MRITIICKGSSAVGLGHINRTLTFVDKSSKFAKFSLIAIIDKGLKHLFRESSDVYIIHREKDLISLLQKKKFHTDKCIIDTTELTHEIQLFLRNKYSEIISISPIFNNYSIVDVLFTRFNSYNYPKHIKIFSGLEFSIFNRYCFQISDHDYNRNLNQKKLSIAISMGGSDPSNKTYDILNSITQLNLDLIIWVFIGKGYSHSCEELIKLNNENSRHELIIASVSNSMWSMLSNCSLSILSGGITYFESIYAGLPSINIFENKLQRSILENDFKNQNHSIHLGLISRDNLLILNNQINYFYKNRDELKIMRENTKGLLDQKGSERTIKKILELETTENLNFIN